MFYYWYYTDIEKKNVLEWKLGDEGQNIRRACLPSSSLFNKDVVVFKTSFEIALPDTYVLRKARSINREYPRRDAQEFTESDLCADVIAVREIAYRV